MLLYWILQCLNPKGCSGQAVCGKPVHFCSGMIIPHFLRAGGANGMDDCPKKERNRKHAFIGASRENDRLGW